MAASKDGACEERIVMLHGYVGNELDLIHTMELEKHLLQCSACTSELERMKDAKTVLGGGQARWNAPEVVRLQILQAIREESARLRNPNSERPSSFLARVAGLVGT